MLALLAAFGLGAALTGGALWYAMEPYSDPVEELRQLDDDPERIYVWGLTDDDERGAWLATLSDMDDDMGGLDATHFVLSNEDELREYDRDELRAKL